MPPQTYQNDVSITENPFLQALNSQIAQKIENRKPILQSKFSNNQQIISLELFSGVLKITFQNSITQSPSESFYLKLDYKLKAQLIFQSIEGQITKKSGLSILKENYRSLNFFSSDQDLIDRWMNQLSRFIILKGFSNQFKPMKYIGRGEFGQVWQVQRKLDGKKFAAKIIDKDICFGQVNGRQAVYNEIQILRKINHPNIVHLECIYESQKSLYIVQQFIQGQLLSDFIRRETNSSVASSSRKIQKQRNLKIMKKLLKALDYLHKMGIAHRDLKPGNIIINSHDWNPYIFDFGLSQFIQTGKYLFQCCGSPGYMAPQIFLKCQFQDLRKCDIFSLGAIFYLLVTQQPLFHGKSTNDIIEQTKNCKKIIPRKLKSCNQTEAELLQLMLQQDPQKRISSQDALFHNLFLDLVYQSLQQIRNPTSKTEVSSKYSMSTDQKNTRITELLTDSIAFIQNEFNFTDILNHQSEDLRNSRNMVTPSSTFAQKIHRRKSRYMSAENIDLENPSDIKEEQSSSAKWKKFGTLEEMLLRGNVWSVKNLIFQNQ